MIVTCIIGGFAIVSTALLIVCCVHSGNISRQEEEKIKEIQSGKMNKK